MSNFDRDKVVSALQKSWTSESSFLPDEWSAENPARGQCAVTAIVVQDYLGGDIVKCDVIGDHDAHFFNKLEDGSVVDLTQSQFPDGSEFVNEKLANREKMLSYPGTQNRYNTLSEKVKMMI